MMRAFVWVRAWTHVWIGLGITLLVWGAVALAQTTAPTLTEVQKLKAQLQQAQEQLLQAQYQLATCEAQTRAARLGEARRTLEQELTVEGFVFDWQTLSFKPKETR